MPQQRITEELERKMDGKRMEDLYTYIIWYQWNTLFGLERYKKRSKQEKKCFKYT